MRKLLEAYYQRQLPLLATFVDSSKAFDTKILRNYGVPLKITDAITAVHTNSSSQDRLGNHLSKSFSINTSVLQGETLAPFLFIIVVDYILWQTDDSHGLKTHAENPEENLPDLYFADDIVFLDETEIAAAEHYDNL